MFGLVHMITSHAPLIRTPSHQVIRLTGHSRYKICLIKYLEYGESVLIKKRDYTTTPDVTGYHQSQHPDQMTLF